MRISINGSSQLIDGDVEALLAHARAAAGDGMAGWWLAQVGLVDALTVIGAIGTSAGGMELGTAVNATFPIHPSALAAKALTTQALCGGQLALGLGVNHAPVVTETWGYEFTRPIRHMLDYVEGLDGLLREGRAHHDGEIWTTNVEAARPTQDPPALLLAAMGPQMLKVAGSRADGTLLWMTGPAAIRSQVAPTITEAAERAGRPTPRIVCSLPVAVTDDEAGMRGFVASILAHYGELPSYRAMLDIDGHDGPGDAMVCGTEDAVRDQLAAIFDAGATEFSAAEIAGSPEDAARTRALLRDLNDG